MILLGGSILGGIKKGSQKKANTSGHKHHIAMSVRQSQQRRGWRNQIARNALSDVTWYQ
jgi:hypothetical protein